VLFATGVTLVLVPALYLIAEDVSAWKRRYADRKDGGSDASALSGA
jgi:hypothetical protein